MTETEVTMDNTGERFTCPADTVILDAGLAAGLHMPHNCRGGACGTCKSKILEGQVDHGWVMSFAITDEEKAQGYCLTCQSKPLSPTLRLRTVEPMHAREAGETLIVPVELTAQVVAAHSVTPSVRRLVISLPRTTRFRFRPGMNMEFMAPGVDQPRPYSIANAPDADGGVPDGQLCFYVTRHEQGRCSNWVHALGVNDQIALRGPYGEFHLPEAPAHGNVLALAGGSGLSPILSVLSHALANGFARPVELLFSVRDRAEIFAADALDALARRHANFGYRITLTREAPASDRCLRGRIPDVLSRELRDLSDSAVLVAGAPAFVDDCVAAAKAAGADPSRIVVDSFLPRAPAVGVPNV